MDAGSRGAQSASSALYAQVVDRAPERAAGLLESVTDDAGIAGAMDQLLGTAADLLRVMTSHPQGSRTVLDRDALLAGWIDQGLIGSGDLPLVGELVTQVAAMAGGITAPLLPSAVAGLAPRQLYLGAWVTTLGVFRAVATVTGLPAADLLERAQRGH